VNYYRILSIDGGGIKGVLTAVLLDRLEEAHPFLSAVDLFAGTSTGGLLALGLAAGFSPVELRDLYDLRAPEVFEDSFLDDLIDLGSLIGADYGITNLKDALTEYFGDMTLGDLPRRVLISTFDLDNEATEPDQRRWKPKFFHNFPGADSDGNQKVVDIAIRTAAAPTYFPIYQGYIDGGVVANNPSVSALAQALNQDTGGQQLDQVALLSLGTGTNPQFIEEQDGDWGLAQWARHLVGLVLDGGVDLGVYQCRQILGDQYQRVNPTLPVAIDLDEYEKMGLLKEIAEAEDLSQAIEWLVQYF
jgi:patatin-like phospholipase/acyl hydrolase